MERIADGSALPNVRRAIVGAWVVGAAGVAALLAVGLSVAIGGPWQTVQDLARIVTVGAIPFLMLAYWELGGLTPTPLARLAQVTGWLAGVAWCVTHLLFVLGAIGIEYETAASGAGVVESLALAVIGLWIAGANLLAGSWLNALRLLGLTAGLGIAVFAAGMLTGGKDDPLVAVGGIGYLVMLPVWAVAMAFYLGRLARAG